jgi:hypothetical protein
MIFNNFSGRKIMRPSLLLINTVKLSPKKSYKIAIEAGLHPSTLSRLINGIERIKPGDERILAIGRVLGIPPEACFQEETI